jgi:hypothetical protein
MEKALRLQMRADSLTLRVENNTDLLASAPNADKTKLRNAIRNDNIIAASLQQEAEAWFAVASRYITEHGKTVVAIPQNADDIADSSDLYGESASAQSSVFDFKILADCPYSEKNPIPVDVSLPDGGVAYRIQLGAFGKPIAMNAFGGLSPVSGEKMASGVVKYYVGLFRAHAEAENALREVKRYGYKDAYIVAFFNRKSIITTRAQELEKLNLSR